MIDALIRTPVHLLNSRLGTVPFLTRHLFLVGLSLSLLPSALLLLAEVPLLGSGVAQLAVGTTLDRAGLLAGLDLEDALGDGGREGGGNGRDGLGVLDGVLAVTSLGLASLAGEDNETLLVGLEAGDVEGERLLAEVLAARVDGNTDGRSVKLGDTGSLSKQNPSATTPITISCRKLGSLKGRQFLHHGYSYLQLSQGETTAGTDLAVVLDGRASHDRSELVGRSGSGGSSLSLTGSSAADLLGGLIPTARSVSLSSSRGAVFALRMEVVWDISYLVEVGLNPALPILAEV